MQVEQDLIISRALVSLYERQDICDRLVFRGGTALNKIYFNPAARYSEDIDLVQVNPGPIGDTINHIRAALDSWLGEPKRKLTERSVKLVYSYFSQDNIPAKLKIEINTTEHFHVLDLVDYEFNVQSRWFNGKSLLKTYQLNELMGTKLRAFYQRRKGRDLFDLWAVLKNNMIDPQAVLHVFNEHGRRTNQITTRAMFEKGIIYSYCIGDGWISKEQCLKLAKNGLVDLEICISTLGNTYLRVPASSLFQRKLSDLIEGNK